MSTEQPDPRPGARRPATMRDIADHVGVSRQLVSMVLRGVDGPSEDSKERILAASRELGYRPNLSARLLRQRSTRLVGLLFTMRNPFEVLVAEGLYERAGAAGFGLVLGPTTDDRSFGSAVDELMQARVEGVIGFNVPMDDPAIAEAASLVPFVLLGEWAEGDDQDNVFVDEVGGLRLAVDHLMALGHRDIAYAGGDVGRVGAGRKASYLTAMAGAGIADRAEVIESDFTEEGGAAAARTLLARDVRPTALIACSDQSAEGAMGVFARSGVRVPEDISVIGFDDSYVASLSYLDMTSVVQDATHTVDDAWAALTRRLADPEAAPRIVPTPTRLTVRGSTGPVPAR